MILLSLRDKAFVKGLVPMLNDMMQPLVQNAISCAVKTAIDNLSGGVDEMLS